MKIHAKSFRLAGDGGVELVRGPAEIDPAHASNSNDESRRAVINANAPPQLATGGGDDV